MDQSNAEHYQAHPPALELPDEVPLEELAKGRDLALEILRAVLADETDARLGEGGELLQREVLGRGQDLDLRAPWPHAGGLRSFASSGDRLVQALEVRAHDLRAQARDQLSHATPAWRPARSPSRR